MTKSLPPEAIEILAAGYVVGDLDQAEAEVFEQLLANNPELAVEVEQLQSAFNQVVYGLNSIEPPNHLQSAILSAVTDTVQTSSRKPFRLPWRTVMGSIAALLILYLGVDNYRLRQDFSIAQDINVLLQQSQTQLFSLKAINTADTATGSFVVNLEKRQGILAVQNLVAPPIGKVYRLWAIADGEKIPCGILKINAQGKGVDKFWMPADFYDTGISGLLVTLESFETGRYPTGTIVMQSKPSNKI
jgi:anti-sigma-K factor RskA